MELGRRKFKARIPMPGTWTTGSPAPLSVSAELFFKHTTGNFFAPIVHPTNNRSLPVFPKGALGRIYGQPPAGSAAGLLVPSLN
jgi:hypothetical protein